MDIYYAQNLYNSYYDYVWSKSNTLNKKKCFYCGKGFTKKNGLVKGVQLYKCGNCGKQFLGGNRISNQNLWSDYVFGKQTYIQLAEKYTC